MSYYFINGRKTSSTKVKSMFKSVGLNIDNPETFFVRQGRITKIVNFKPSDLRDMLEEAAGISYYKEVADGCVQVMTRKGREHKLQEERMYETLGPKIAMLERQKELERKYNHLKAESETLTRELDQMKYLRLLQTLGVDLFANSQVGPAEAFGISGSLDSHPQMRELKSRIHELNELIKQVNEEIEQFKSSLDDAAKKRIERLRASTGEETVDPEIQELDNKREELKKKLEKQQLEESRLQSTVHNAEKQVHKEDKLLKA